MTKSLQELYREARTSPEPYQDPTVLVEDGEDTENDPLFGKMRKEVVRALLQDAGVGKTLINIILALIPEEQPNGEKSALAADAALMKRFPSAGRLR